MSDYKMDAQVRAEEMAEEKGLDYHSLPLMDKCALYELALCEIREKQIAAADYRRKAERENALGEEILRRRAGK